MRLGKRPTKGRKMMKRRRLRQSAPIEPNNDVGSRHNFFNKGLKSISVSNISVNWYDEYFIPNLENIRAIDFPAEGLTDNQEIINEFNRLHGVFVSKINSSIDQLRNPVSQDNNGEVKKRILNEMIEKLKEIRQELTYIDRPKAPGEYDYFYKEKIDNIAESVRKSTGEFIELYNNYNQTYGGLPQLYTGKIIRNEREIYSIALSEGEERNYDNLRYSMSEENYNRDLQQLNRPESEWIVILTNTIKEVDDQLPSQSSELKQILRSFIENYFMFRRDMYSMYWNDSMDNTSEFQALTTGLGISNIYDSIMENTRQSYRAMKDGLLTSLITILTNLIDQNTYNEDEARRITNYYTYLHETRYKYVLSRISETLVSNLQTIETNGILSNPILRQIIIREVTQMLSQVDINTFVQNDESLQNYLQAVGNHLQYLNKWSFAMNVALTGIDSIPVEFVKVYLMNYLLGLKLDDSSIYLIESINQNFATILQFIQRIVEIRNQTINNADKLTLIERLVNTFTYNNQNNLQNLLNVLDIEINILSPLPPNEETVMYRDSIMKTASLVYTIQTEELNEIAQRLVDFRSNNWDQDYTLFIKKYWETIKQQQTSSEGSVETVDDEMRENVTNSLSSKRKEKRSTAGPATEGQQQGQRKERRIRPSVGAVDA